MERGYVRKANLLPTISIPWSKIAIRVRNGELDVNLSTIKDPKGMGVV